jgi:hypothetical protein
MNLEELKKGMILSGRLSEIHIHNLKQYPFIAFDGLDSFEMSYNLEQLANNEDGAYLEYILKFKKTTPKGIEEKAKILSAMVKVLLWNNVEVRVAYKKNGKIVYVKLGE